MSDDPMADNVLRLREWLDEQISACIRNGRLADMDGRSHGYDESRRIYEQVLRILNGES